MAYTVVAASTLDDVISQICAFAVANAGFTNEGTATYSGATRYRISKGGIYWTFVRSTHNSRYHILGRMSYSISHTADPTTANGQRNWTEASFWGFSGPFTNLYLFSEGTCVFAVVEVTAGVFTHLCIGNITKLDTFEGGEFISGTLLDYGNSTGNPSVWQFQDASSSYNCTLFPANLSSKNAGAYTSAMRWVRPSGKVNDQGDFASFGCNLNSNQAVGDTQGGFTEVLYERTPNSATSRSVLFPINIYNYDYTLANGLYHLSGVVPGIRHLNLRLLDPAEIVLNDWQVFPYCAKSSDKVKYPYTANRGFAYKRVT